MASHNYIAILGRQPELGMIELESLVGSEGVRPFGAQAALLETELDVDDLGGTVKIAKILYRGEPTPLRSLPVDLAKMPVSETKMPFALSAYGVRDSSKMLLAAGLEIKKQLKHRGPLRLVTPSRGLAVSAAELRHNRVLGDGFELLVVASGDEMIVARTVGVQDIDWYSKRDYDRPARSAKVGMLPPKLAQILINTVPAGPVTDPFCGTGVVLQEALLLERPATGSDLSEEMVEATRKNLTWLERQVATPLPPWQVQLADARQLKLPTGSSVVSEGYLGPNLRHVPSAKDMRMVKQELLGLYTETLKNWASQLTSGSSVSLCVPAWRMSSGWEYLGLVDELPRLGYTLKGFKHAPSPVLYARADQVVGRQLLLLRKN